MQFNLSVEKKQAGVYIVSLSGSVDSENYVDLEYKLKDVVALPLKVVILDMEQLEYINSAGLSSIFHTRTAIENSNGTFIMINLKPHIKRAFDIFKAIPSMDIFESMSEADAYLDRLQRENNREDNKK